MIGQLSKPRGLRRPIDATPLGRANELFRLYKWRFAQATHASPSGAHKVLAGLWRQYLAALRAATGAEDIELVVGPSTFLEDTGAVDVPFLRQNTPVQILRVEGARALVHVLADLYEGRRGYVPRLSLAKTYVRPGPRVVTLGPPPPVGPTPTRTTLRTYDATVEAPGAPLMDAPEDGAAVLHRFRFGERVIVVEGLPYPPTSRAPQGWVRVESMGRKGFMSVAILSRLPARQQVGQSANRLVGLGGQADKRTSGQADLRLFDLDDLARATAAHPRVSHPAERAFVRRQARALLRQPSSVWRLHTSEIVALVGRLRDIEREMGALIQERAAVEQRLRQVAKRRGR